MALVGIYKITSPSNKVYIGQLEVRNKISLTLKNKYYGISG